MTKPFYSDMCCSVCGTVIGKSPGVVVIPDLLCDNPLCQIQVPTSVTEARDQLVFFAVNNGIPVTSVARYTGVSRQRVYQIIEQEKAGA